MRFGWFPPRWHEVWVLSAMYWTIAVFFCEIARAILTRSQAWLDFIAPLPPPVDDDDDEEKDQ